MAESGKQNEPNFRLAAGVVWPVAGEQRPVNL